MSQYRTDVNSTIAPITNVAICMRAMQRAIERPAHLPGLVAFYGPSGWGKSFAAAYTANVHRAYYVECKSSWTRKALLLAICDEMGIKAADTIYELNDQVAEQLVRSGRPLIIDEFDHLVERRAVELVRDIYEASSAPILLIGEERLEANLRQWERFHNRILDWLPAEPASEEDVRHLAGLYCSRVRVAPDLLARVRDVTRGAVRRICINLERIQEHALSAGLDTVTLADWGDRELFSGAAPARRV